MSDRFRTRAISQVLIIAESHDAARRSARADRAEGVYRQPAGRPVRRCASAGGAQSVHSRGMANEPLSAWRRLRVSTPETASDLQDHEALAMRSG